MTAFTLAREISTVFKNAPTIPYATGNLKNNGVFAVEVSRNKAYVVIGGVLADYAWWLEYSKLVGKTTHVNRHKGFVEKIIYANVLPYLETKYGAKRK